MPAPAPDVPAPTRGACRACRAGRTRRGGDGGPAGDRTPDDGQTTVLVALVVGAALLLLVGLTHLGAAVVDRAQARTAADAAALAGVIEQTRGAAAGSRAAAAVAADNGATLVAYAVDGGCVEVTVEVDGAHATSRAERVVRASP